ncbi:FliA/WhiG family RNA polymerase sigma factor [Candidatus Latescibacterota bacterium]
MTPSSGGDRRLDEIRDAGGKGISVYDRMSSDQKRDILVKDNLQLVNFIVSRLAIGLPNWIDKRDLISSGVIGLIDAAKNFNPQKGVKFTSFASSRIKGAIIDELRSLDWVPRSVREKSKLIEGTILKLIEELGRFPNDNEVAEELGWDEEKYNKSISQISGTTLLSLDEIITTSAAGDTITRIDTVKGDSRNPLKDIERRELLDNIVKVISGLSEQERLVIALYYYEELTLKEIGMVVKVSESRISQIHTTAILKIRARLRSLYSKT